MVKTAVILELVLPGKGVVAKSAGEGLGRVLGVDVALKSRVLVEGRAALALVGLVFGLLGVLVKGEVGSEGDTTETHTPDGCCTSVGSFLVRG